jgi:hypothetical protein
MGLKFNLADAKDRDWLEKRGIDIKALYRSLSEKSMGIIEHQGKKRLEVKEIAQKRSKYGNVITEAEGFKWASKYEYECWQILTDLQREGKIFNLKRQLTVKFTHNNVVLWTTRPDFYFEVDVLSTSDSIRREPVYADAKNSFTAGTRSFKTTQKMFKAFYNREILTFLKDKGTNIQDAIKHYVVE